MSDSSYKPTNLGSGIFQWTEGTAYKTSLGGSFATSAGQTTALAASIDNKMTLGTANSLKYALETAVTFGSKFEYKDVAEIDFKKGSISILEHSGARCLDLFQASAGLGTIDRAAFEAQRAAARTAMKALIAVDVFLALSTITMAGLGTGFGSGGAPDNARAIGYGVTGAQTLISLAPIIGVFCSGFLKDKATLTKPKTWNPNALLQASSTKGVFIGSAPQADPLPATVASFIKLNDTGTTWAVFRDTVPGPTLEGENVGLLSKQEHITGYSETPLQIKSTVVMNPETVSISTGNLTLKGLTGPGSLLRTGSSFKTLFDEIDLTAQIVPGDKVPLNASLVLSASPGPSAKLSAGVEPTLSSLQATAQDLTIKSGPTTSLKLDASSATLSSLTTKMVATTGRLALNGVEVKISGVSGVSINGTLIRLG
jgi:hypothetical protein